MAIEIIGLGQTKTLNPPALDLDRIFALIAT